jgi:hypothetical protein
MATTEFSVVCQVCQKPVEGFSHNIQYVLTKDEAIQARESVELSCGCTIDFLDWQIDGDTGICKMFNFAGTHYITFYDKEMLMEDEEE